MSGLSSLDNGLADKFGKLEEASVDVLTDYIVGGGGDKTQTQVARVASGVLSIVQRRRSIELNRDRLYFAMARAMTNDPVKLADYIRQTQPSSPFAKLSAEEFRAITETA